MVFGVEDSLVSSVGVLSGIAIAGTELKTIILAGVVLIFVEAFSMGVGSLLADNTEREFKSGTDTPLKRSVMPSIVMFFSYFFAGFIPLAPYLILPVQQALGASIVLALAALFILGFIAGSLSKTRVMRQGIEMLIIGGVAVLLGVGVGLFVDSLGI